MKSQNKKVFHLFLRKDIHEMFQRLYPHCETRFCENAINLAINDKSFFDRVFFGVVNEKN